MMNAFDEIMEKLYQYSKSKHFFVNDIVILVFIHFVSSAGVICPITYWYESYEFSIMWLETVAWSILWLYI